MKCVLLVTGTVFPDEKTPYLFIKNSDERLEQYKNSLLWFIKETIIDNIVFCDNSLCSAEQFSDISDLAKSKGKKFEFISFSGNKSMVLEKGKGYGEGEIIQYALNNSVLMKDTDYFIKVTGRLKIINFDKILRKLKPNGFYINMFNKVRVDTRLYAISKSMYLNFFIHAYEKVNDHEGYYLEHSFTDVIRNNTIPCRNFPYYPQFDGVSGSTGKQYNEKPINAVYKNILSRINFYGFKR